ncbi:hypothetical protein TIFTF001_019979 [Ficus carica]|uniref:Uncharacterized protein n=1 Tax=Ficus carica TaxID=3494 RepID=A0AA88AHD6_FICCA|nr:hypothetical protein TIFTF001_019979 [Ficus carica]
MKLEKLLCLKYLGSKSSENSAGDHTIKPLPSAFHEITDNIDDDDDLFLPFSPSTLSDDIPPPSSSKSYVFDRNGAGLLVLGDCPEDVLLVPTAQYWFKSSSIPSLFVLQHE